MHENDRLNDQSHNCKEESWKQKKKFYIDVFQDPEWLACHRADQIEIIGRWSNALQ
jgi:hypothetical protein